MQVGPQHALVWIWHEPVGKPHATHVHKDTEARLNKTEGGHQLGGTGEGTAKFRFEHTQNGGNERPGMADADPEHGIDEENAPIDRAVHTGDTETFRDHFCPGVNQTVCHNCTKYNDCGPELPGGLAGHGFHDHVVHLPAGKRVEH